MFALILLLVLVYLTIGLVCAWKMEAHEWLVVLFVMFLWPYVYLRDS